MTGQELRTLRERLGLSQTELAQSLNQSYATVSRWERGKSEIPDETSRLLACMSELIDKSERSDVDVTAREITQAVKAAGVIGVVVGAATSGFLARGTVAALAALTPFTWLGGLAGLGVIGAIPFFKKAGFGKHLPNWRRSDGEDQSL